MLKAGTFLSRAGAVATTAATVFGILAHDTDATAATCGVVYLTGSSCAIGSWPRTRGRRSTLAFEDAIRVKGLYFERSDRNVKLRVNLITQGSFLGCGTEVPEHLIPVWCIKKHRRRRRRSARRYASGAKSCEPKPRAPRESRSQEGSQESSRRQAVAVT